MARNVEIKARLRDLASVTARVADVATEGPTDIHQDDTFFACAHGRLKLRSFSHNNGQLIFYQRADVSGPKTSFYVLTPTPEPDALRETLSLAYGVTGRVIKHRTLYLFGRTRVHLDRVRDLGDFLELEVVLTEDEDEQAGLNEANHLMQELGIASEDLVEGAYIDLLRATGAHHSSAVD